MLSSFRSCLYLNKSSGGRSFSFSAFIFSEALSRVAVRLCVRISLLPRSFQVPPGERFQVPPGLLPNLHSFIHSIPLDPPPPPHQTSHVIRPSGVVSDPCRRCVFNGMPISSQNSYLLIFRPGSELSSPSPPLELVIFNLTFFHPPQFVRLFPASWKVFIIIWLSLGVSPVFYFEPIPFCLLHHLLQLFLPSSLLSDKCILLHNHS